MVNIKNVETSTEERILQAATKVFTEKGLDGARMQDIADEAEINKAMLHYYFRNKQKLFNLVFTKNVVELLKAFEAILDSDLNFEEKLHAFISSHIKAIHSKPFLGLFIVSESAKNPKFLQEIFEKTDYNNFRKKLDRLILEETKANRMKTINTDHFLCNVLSLCAYPFIAQSLLKVLLKKSDRQYKTILKSRIDNVTEIILNDILKYKGQ